MIATNNQKLYKLIWSSKDQGRNLNKIRKLNANKFRYIHDYLGFNFRMTEIQAKIGNIQLSNLKDWIKKRNVNARIIIKFLNQYPNIFEKTQIKKKYQHAFYRLCVPLKISKLKINNLLKECHQKGLQISSGPCPEIYREKEFKKIFGRKYTLKNANYLSGRTISFLVDQTITRKKLNIFLRKFKLIISRI